MIRLEVVVGGQFGSEGKGAIAAWRAGRLEVETGGHLVAVRVGGPNAGHCVVGPPPVYWSDYLPYREFAWEKLAEPLAGADAALGGSDRYRWKLRQLPTAALSAPGSTLMLGPGSEIDLPVLLSEIDTLAAAGVEVGPRLLLDREATLILPEHKMREAQADLNRRIGSTSKGIGAARAARLMREPGLRVGDDPEAEAALAGRDVSVTDTADWLRSVCGSWRGEGGVLVEGTQGYGLGLHAGYYPTCSSADFGAIQMLAMAGINPWQAIPARPGLDDELLGPAGSMPLFAGGSPTVWVCLRPYPIRVAGDSGVLKDETSWEALGLAPEVTTVTGKTRRVGGWDRDLARAAIRANGGPGGPVRVALTMMDQLVPTIYGAHDLQNLTSADIDLLEERVEWYSEELGQPISAAGTGPDSVLDLRAGLPQTGGSSAESDRLAV